MDCHRKIKILLLILMLCIQYTLIFAQELDLTPPSGRWSALGGMHVTLDDNIDTLLSNPAGLAGLEPQMQVSQLTLHIRGPVFDITNLIVEVTNSGDDVLDVISSSSGQTLDNLKAAINLSGPVSFAFATGGFGFGLYNWGGMAFDLQGTVATGYLNIDTQDTLLLIGGYGHRFMFSEEAKIMLDLGASLKGFARGEVHYENPSLVFFNTELAAGEIFLFTSPLDLKLGISGDLGMIFHMGGWFKAGLVAKDVAAAYWTTTYGNLEDFIHFSGGGTPEFDYALVNLCAGVMFQPPLGDFPWFISDFKIMLDYEDILDFAVHPDTATNPILHVGVGVEVVFLEVLAVRVGFYQGLFSAGLGIDLTIFQLDVSMFGSELGLEPGLLPTYNVMIGLKFLY
ncbi:MAG: hypothetical protein JW822_09610 [Spirochaetales bacterium]|nr:hypothetical protein [Spirochaetales bacterium]